MKKPTPAVRSAHFFVKPLILTDNSVVWDVCFIDEDNNVARIHAAIGEGDSHYLCDALNLALGAAQRRAGHVVIAKVA